MSNVIDFASRRYGHACEKLSAVHNEKLSVYKQSGIPILQCMAYSLEEARDTFLKDQAYNFLGSRMVSVPEVETECTINMHLLNLEDPTCDDHITPPYISLALRDLRPGEVPPTSTHDQSVRIDATLEHFAAHVGRQAPENSLHVCEDIFGEILFGYDSLMAINSIQAVGDNYVVTYYYRDETQVTLTFHLDVVTKWVKALEAAFATSQETDEH